MLGVRGDLVTSDAGSVQGYNDTMQIWTADAAAFNARDRRRTDLHLDLTALLRYAPHAMVGFEAGYARKTRSANLYERYVWSTNPMAALMNNFVGDGNGYVGNIDLKPEVAHTLSGSVDLHDADRERVGREGDGLRDPGSRLHRRAALRLRPVQQGEPDGDRCLRIPPVRQ